MAARPNTPPRPIIVKKIIEAPHAGHHGGAWKVAYADFVTAMMAFFLLMWLLGATTEKQRKALADYFAPTIVETKQGSAGSNGLFGGDSIVSADDYPHAAGQTGTRSITIPKDAVGGPKEASGRESEKMKFQQVAKSLMERVQKQGDLKRLARNLRFTETVEGMRIDVIDDADFSMFASGTSQLTPEGARLFSEIAKPVAEVTNQVMVRGHTDAAPWSAKSGTNNWRLSVDRAEIVRHYLEFRGVTANRFSRIEGVADREPYIPSDRFDPRNRRISITLGWRTAADN
ncbi:MULTISPECIES: flagellar motor protein MotB [unclassified Sphingopyxis]|jgi:chemotaxis protein MotB|uniref:flagellar motor protein MotB n=1 Tax=unclassified Sphingopyxis TaxID=2614943 RepID=UPI002857429B|nr:MULTISPECIES: flagellar motor protein MotB [unclassified Sphingopyxis]MDR6833476.1 chemotaxis protein MotB [Sphingopyxis sp. BE122]MDR7225745.1 chemotaxis protein MotB [Sphingopyxis sp. BE259]